MIWSETKPSIMKSEKSCVQMHRNVGKKSNWMQMQKSSSKSIQKHTKVCNWMQMQKLHCIMIMYMIMNM